MGLVMFSKMLKRKGDLSVDEAGDEISELGFDGVDLTVRPGGHVAPEDAADRLPGAVETLRSKGLSVPMITTSITDASEPHAEEIFATADDLGIGHMKLGYWRYENFGSIRAALDRMEDDLAGIRELGEEHSVTPALHTHSGDHLTANPAFLTDILEQGDPASLGMYMDLGHLVLEGSQSVWEMNIDLVSEYIQMVSIKDPAVYAVESEDGVAWERKLVPLGEGMVPWTRAFDRLERIGFDGPMSVHSEYHDYDFEEIVAQTDEDVDFLRRLVSAE